MSESKTQGRPIISVAVRPNNNRDWLKFLETLRELAQADLTMRTEKRAMGEPIVISGMSESHLQGICDRITREYKIEIDVAEPEVIYLETIQNQAEGEGKFIRQAGGRGWYAHVKIRLEPRERGSGYEMVDEMTDSSIPSQFVQAINFGIQQAMKAGALDGREMVDLRAVLYAGSYHESDSNEMSFNIAGSEAFSAAVRKANPVLLEPILSARGRHKQANAKSGTSRETRRHNHPRCRRPRSSYWATGAYRARSRRQCFQNGTRCQYRHCRQSRCKCRLCRGTPRSASTTS